MTAPTLYPHPAAALRPLLETHPYSRPLLNSEAETMYATFLSLPDGEWAIALALPSPSSQVHVLHSLEPRYQAATDAERAQAEETVVAVVRELFARYPTHDRIGALHIAWAPSLRAALGASDRGVYRTYLSPTPPTAAVEADMEGLVLDSGREEDVDAILATTSYHSAAYLRDRIAGGHMAAVRSGDTPVAFILSQADGSLGSLWTAPAYRRRGLAKLVANTRERASTGCHVYVGTDNEASARLWVGMGWAVGWDVTWVLRAEYNEVH